MVGVLGASVNVHRLPGSSSCNLYLSVSPKPAILTPIFNLERDQQYYALQNSHNAQGKYITGLQQDKLELAGQNQHLQALCAHLDRERMETMMFANEVWAILAQADQQRCPPNRGAVNRVRASVRKPPMPRVGLPTAHQLPTPPISPPTMFQQSRVQIIPEMDPSIVVAQQPITGEGKRNCEEVMAAKNTEQLCEADNAQQQLIKKAKVGHHSSPASKSFGKEKRTDTRKKGKMLITHSTVGNPESESVEIPATSHAQEAQPPGQAGYTESGRNVIRLDGRGAFLASEDIEAAFMAAVPDKPHEKGEAESLRETVNALSTTAMQLE